MQDKVPPEPVPGFLLVSKSLQRQHYLDIELVKVLLGPANGLMREMAQ